MPGNVKMTLPDGRIVDGVVVGLKKSTEQWSEFELDDGTKIKAKITLSSVTRAVNDYDPTGVPWYQTQLIPVLAPMDVPDKLKKKKGK